MDASTILERRWRRGAILAAALALVAAIGASRAARGRAQAAAKRTALKTSAKHAHATRVVSGPIVKTYGSKTAPITMEVFTDYECPSCGMLYEQTLRPMITEYVAAGKVYLVHHDYPLTGHKYSGIAARWADAAAEIGDFEPVEGALYGNQATWGNDGNIQQWIAGSVSSADFKKMQAIVNGCSGTAPQAQPDRSNPLAKTPHPCAIDESIASDIELGYKIPVTATPTYKISYRCRCDETTPPPAGNGFVSWPILKQYLDSLPVK